mmetsp:Transcript_14099/g.40442  ORF Transcript_14099/g.40442 Transcript_14099/m.40442 type:complete len:230 (+) Transcript_14099:332-1021(+)
MSKLSEYSKFDRIDDSDDDVSSGGRGESAGDGHVASSVGSAVGAAPTSAAAAAAAVPAPIRTKMTKKNDDGRYIFECNGIKIYEWEQSLEEVNMYIEAPPGVQASQLRCNIRTNRLQIGLRGSDRFFIDEETYSKVKIDDSSWYLDDGGVINIVLAKVYRGETWESPLLGRDGGDSRAGQAVDPATKVEIQKELMLLRFQEEHPGFDFRGATFNGSVPDPRDFMGGIGS